MTQSPQKTNSARGSYVKMRLFGLLISAISFGIASYGLAEEKPAAKVIVPAGSPGQNLSLDLGGGVKMELVWIPPGEFMMGSPEGEARQVYQEDPKDAGKKRAPLPPLPEGPLHRVKISQGFWMGKYEVTQAQWQQVIGSSFPSQFKLQKGVDLPMDGVSWDTCYWFCYLAEERVRKQSGEKVRFRLPTEAEWEYACRAGTTTRFNTGDGDDALDRAGWTNKNSENKTHPVGQKAPNAWGLYDMHGNVQEWCSDWYAEYPSWEVTDPTGRTPPDEISAKVVRGSSFNGLSIGAPQGFRCADRYGYAPSRRGPWFGFRVVVVPLAAVYGLAEEKPTAKVTSEGGTVTQAEAGGQTTIQPKAGQALSLNLGDGVKMELVWIPPGEFMMGTPEGEVKQAWFSSGPSDPKIMGAHSQAPPPLPEGPQHRVKITQGFWMGKYEVTQAQWKRVIGSDKSYFKGADLPAEVHLFDCYAFFYLAGEQVRKQSGVKMRFRLPTEAEWEYACRAGTTTRFYTGDGEDDLDRAAWTNKNCADKSSKRPDGLTTHPVGQKAPNAWGLYDMLGNLREWCSDIYDTYPAGEATDPTGPPPRDGRGSNVVRGSSIMGLVDLAVGGFPTEFRCAGRYGMPATHGGSGFRVVAVPFK